MLGLFIFFRSATWPLIFGIIALIFEDPLFDKVAAFSEAAIFSVPIVKSTAHCAIEAGIKCLRERIWISERR